jgi:signal transduction histidine kinase
MEWNSIILLITAFFILAEGLFVFLKNKRGLINIIFFINNLAVAFWAFCIFLVFNLVDKKTTLIWAKLTFIGPIIFAAGFLYFSLYFPKRDQPLKPRQHFLILFLPLLFFILSPTNFIVKEVLIVGGRREFIRNTIGHSFFGIYFLSYMSMAVLNLLFKWRKSSGIYRAQLRYVLLGIAISLAFGGTTNLIIPLLFHTSRFSNLGPCFALIFFSFIAYAIVKHRLMDIYIILRKSLIYSLLLIAILTTYGVLIFTMQQFFSQKPGSSQLVAIIAASFLIALGMRPLEDLVAKLTDKIFFKARYDYKNTLSQVSSAISSIIDLNHLANTINGILLNSVKVENSTLFLKSQDNHSFSDFLDKSKDRLSINLDSPMISYLNQQQEPLVLEELERTLLEESYKREDLTSFKKIAAQMQELHIALALPLISKDKLLGIVSLGRKRSQDMFFDEDLKLLTTLANQTALAIDNISLIQEEREMAQKVAILKEREKYVNILEEKNQELEHAYNELKATQAHLIQSEKMATVGTLAGGVAHEINTPLGAILTNAEMLLKEAPLPQKENLELIRMSTLKCKTIVEQLLRYSHKPTQEFELVEINQIIDDACILIEHQFLNEGIRIEKLYSQLPHLKANANELAQVITNILLNAKDAIKKTQHPGLIQIKTYSDNNYLNIEITDNGCGIPEENLTKIFDPFFTTKDIGQGTGLGLYITQRIMERHSGKIEVKSLLNQGTTITVRLPVKNKD